MDSMKIAPAINAHALSMSNSGEPVQGAGLPDRRIGQAIVREFAELADAQHSPVQCGALLLLAVQQMKLDRVRQGEALDGSWQAGVAWIASMTEGLPDGEAIARAASMAMTAQIDPRTDACARRIHEITREMRAGSYHRRDQLLVRVLAQDEWDALAADSSRLSVRIAGDREGLPEDALCFRLPAQGHLKHKLLSAIPGRLGCSLLLEPYEREAGALFVELRRQVREDDELSEVAFFVRDEHRGAALALARTLAICWNVPCLDLGEMDLVVLAGARQVMAAEAGAHKIARAQSTG